MLQKKQTTIACFGDSITQGNVSYNWVKELSQEFQSKNFIFKNFGINGHLAYNALQRIDKVVKSNPDIITILLGTNDISATLNEVNRQRYMQWFQLPKRPDKEWFVENMDAILNILKQKTSAKILLFTLPLLGEDLNEKTNLLVHEYNLEIKELAKKHQVQLLDLNQKMIEFLKKNQPTPPQKHPEGIGMMTKAILKHYFLFQKWDKIAEQNGYLMLTDGVHLNGVGGKILMDLVKKEL